MIDLGFGPRSLSRRMKEANLEARPIDAVFLTHGHSDHCQGVGSRKVSESMPVYMNRGTRREGAGLREIENWREFKTGRPVRVSDFTVEAFAISHDASEPVGFRIEAEGKTGAVVTDLGEMTPRVKSRLKGCDWLVLESNHDEDLLKMGPYPWEIKQRVLSRVGHLSNRTAAEFIRDDYDGSAAHIFLAHLSRHNNHPEIALRSARSALRQRPRKGLFESCRIHLTFQTHPSNVIHL